MNTLSATSKGAEKALQRRVLCKSISPFILEICRFDVRLRFAMDTLNGVVNSTSTCLRSTAQATSYPTHPHPKSTRGRTKQGRGQHPAAVSTYRGKCQLFLLPTNRSARITLANELMKLNYWAIISELTYYPTLGRCRRIRGRRSGERGRRR